MKTDILIFAGLTLTTILLLVFTAGKNVVEIQLHDTYIALDKISLIVLTIGPLTLLTFLLLGLIRKFKTKWTNIGLIIGLGLVSLIFFRVSLIQINYRDQVRSNSKLSALPLPTADRERYVNDLNKKIILTWGLFGACIVGIGLTCFQTYNLTSKKR